MGASACAGRVSQPLARPPINAQSTWSYSAGQCVDLMNQPAEREHCHRADLPRTALASRREPQAPAESDPYRWVLNLLQPFGALLSIARELTQRAPASADRETGDPVTNLYLVVCGLDQILSDYLHRHFYELDHPHVPARLRSGFRAASKVERSLRRAWLDTAGRRLIRIEADLSRLSLSLARTLLEGRPTPASTEVAAIARLSIERYPAPLRSRPPKLPQSFRGVDLYPEDCVLLARRALAHFAGHAGPLAVIGLRTSGLYMAPLCAAALERHGHPRVELLSMRPGSPMLLAEERRLRAISAAGGGALVVDDPSWHGLAFAEAYETLGRLGFAQARILMTACEIGNQPAFKQPESRAESRKGQDRVWTGFGAAQKIFLGKSEWHIHARLSDEAAERCLNRPQALARLNATRVTVSRGHPFSETGEAPAVTGVPSGNRQRRYHVQKVYEILIERDGERRSELAVGRGVGLGFFGYHSYLVAQALDGLTPDLLGLEGGVMFTRWQVGARADAAPITSRDLDAVGVYIAQRSNALRLESGGSAIPGTRAVYTGARRVARTLGMTMGGVGALAQFRAADSLSRHVAPEHPASIDARMGRTEWVRNDDGDLLKVDFEEHGVDITDRWVNDPVHDLASASFGFRLDAASEARLVQGYSLMTGDRVRLQARLTFHKLMVGLTELETVMISGGEIDSPARREEFARDLVATEERLTRTVNSYLAGLYLSGITSRETGDVWALDLDDTLETDRPGFQATSPAGALALRALAAHDQLVLASTGRSLAEVQDRCETYGIAGGIAEYGAVAWDARHSRLLTAVTDESRRSIETLREAILAETEIVVDPRYEHTLRLFRNAPEGRRGMKGDQIVEVIDRHRIQGLEVVEGYRKTVVWPAGCDKSRALLPLLRSLGVDRASRRLHVVGDEVTDLGLMLLADRRHAPGNAGEALRERAAGLSMTVAKRGHGAGVLEVVRHQLHSTGARCAVCRSPKLDRADAVFAELLGVQDRSRLARFAYALHPASLRAFEL